ncbi:DNA-processing protein DprA [Phycisphaerales bacterium]|nr:DNA-processing protein DprA [Phycisphaerales bacterium]RPG19275.1 MAG: DNA-protecting protein DprA [Phycisphaera sp. TMED9]
MRDERKVTALAMQGVKGWGPRTVSRLWRAFGSIDQILNAPVSAIAAVTGESELVAAARIRSLDRKGARSDVRHLERLGGSVVTLFDADYPALLAGIDDPPVTLRCLGSPAVLNHDPVISVVGARRCSAIGIDLAARFSAALCEAGYAICSGGAIGVDAAAHRAALRRGRPTIAVLGSGLSHLYPPENASLFQAIAAEGGVVLSEYPCDAGPRPGRFPERNRIIAGLSLGVVVFEAGLRSGAMITARLAAEDYGREVLAIPGRVDTGASAGCHRAIREGWACLVDHPDQIVERVQEQVGLLALHRASLAGPSGSSPAGE